MADANPHRFAGPDPTPSSPDATAGRRRSNSARSQLSQPSQPSHFLTPVAERAEWAEEGGPARRRGYDRRPSIRIRRASSMQNVVPGGFPVEGSRAQDFAPSASPNTTSLRRNRSVSDPQRGTTLPSRGAARHESSLPCMNEETATATAAATATTPPPTTTPPPATGTPRTPRRPLSGTPATAEPKRLVPQPSSLWRPLRRARTNIGSGADQPRAKGKEKSRAPEDGSGHAEYEEDLVDLLDLVDPEVATLQTLTNVQNSLFVPDLGKYLNRRPTYNLTKRAAPEDSTTSSDDDDPGSRVPPDDEARPAARRVASGATLNTISSNVNERYYAVLPHGVRLPGWTEEEKLELNDHVRHMLHSRRSKFKRSMKGFKQYVSKPLGFFVTFYALSITAFGLAWVLFLIGWINVGGSREDYLINIIDNVLVALFAIMGDGLAPFRAVDTYHMCFIAHYHHLTWRLRREQSLPRLANNSDLPAAQPDEVQDVEKQEFSVLSPAQVERLQHHQKRFAKSHSFYKPHETSTHYAFPLRLLVAIVVLLDCHSLLQIALGTCTWAISYHVRPFALTTVILCCSITVNILAGVLITVGDHRTRKKDVRERMVRQELTADAIRKVEKKRRHELKKAGLIRDGEGIGSALDVPEPAPEDESEVVRTLDPGAHALIRGSERGRRRDGDGDGPRPTEAEMSEAEEKRGGEGEGGGDSEGDDADGKSKSPSEAKEV